LLLENRKWEIENSIWFLKPAIGKRKIENGKWYGNGTRQYEPKILKSK